MKISFLTSVMNRTHHLKQTYLHNIDCCISNNKNCELEFVLLNYNSKDDTDEYVKKNIQPHSKYIKFNYIKNTNAKYFDMSLTKNILGKFATSEILCWLDADNFIYDNFVEFIYESFCDNENIVMNVDYSKKTSGMCGRVVCTKTHFNEIGGYDQKMNGWGYEEIDFINRSVKYGKTRINIPLKFLGKINHSESERMRNYEVAHTELLSHSHSHSQMKFKSNYDNYIKSIENIKNGKLVANQTIDWGLL